MIVVWAVTPLFAQWIATPTNVLFQHNVLNAQSVVLELGCGIAGIVGMSLSSHVERYILTDQDYVLRLVRQNIAENNKSTSAQKPSHHARNRSVHGRRAQIATPEIMVLDWEQSSLRNLEQLLSDAEGENAHGVKFTGLDCIVACDCVFNEALIRPFVETCATLCEIRRRHPSTNPTVCVIAQQLRSADVFEEWLAVMTERFKVWRVESGLGGELRTTLGSGFVIHFAVLPD